MMKNRAKIIHISSAHPTMDVRIFHKECKFLSTYYDVTLIIPSSKMGIIDNVKIIPLSTGNSRITKFLINPFKILYWITKLDGDLYHFHDPILLPLAILLSIFGKKTIYDIHEDVPKQLLTKMWLPNFIRKPLSFFWKYLEFFSSKFISGFCCVVNSIREKFPEDKSITLSNFPILSDFPKLKSKYNLRNNKIIYMGNFSKIRGIDNFIEAFNQAKRDNFTFEIFGNSIPPSFYDELKINYNMNNLKIYPPLDYKLLIKKLYKVKMGIMLYKQTPNNRIALPTKIFDYMASELPIIASDLPLVSAIVTKYKCGIIVDPENIEEIKYAIDYLIKNPHEAEKMGKRGRKLIENLYNWENEFKKLLILYDKILNN